MKKNTHQNYWGFVWRDQINSSIASLQQTFSECKSRFKENSRLSKSVFFLNFNIQKGGFLPC